MERNAKNQIVKKNWNNSFTLVGRYAPKNTFFKIDEHSEKSNWTYNSLTLGVDCGEKCGIVTADLMGGYSTENKNLIYAHGKKQDDNGNYVTDYSNPITIDWDDRLDESILEDIGDRDFINVGLELTDKGKVYYKKFLSAYDAIEYVQSVLKEGMNIRVKGELNYSTYNDVTQVHKSIKAIYIDTKTEEKDFSADFIQSILIDKDSVSATDIDKEKNLIYVNARVLDYVKEIDGKEIRDQYPFAKTFEFYTDMSDMKKVKVLISKLFKVKKDITQITFRGKFVEGGNTITATLDDLPDDIKDLVLGGVYTEEEALAECSAGGGRERHMIITRPYIRLVGEDKTPVLQKFEQEYTEDDFVYDSSDEEEEITTDDDLPFDEDLSWLSGV